MQTASVMKSGNSAVITLPSTFRKRTGIEIGDKVSVEYPDETSMLVKPVETRREEREAAARELFEFAESMRGKSAGSYADGKEGIRDVLEKRYV